MMQLPTKVPLTTRGQLSDLTFGHQTIARAPSTVKKEGVLKAAKQQ